MLLSQTHSSLLMPMLFFLPCLQSAAASRERGEIKYYMSDIVARRREHTFSVMPVPSLVNMLIFRCRQQFSFPSFSPRLQHTSRHAMLRAAIFFAVVVV